MAESVTDYAGWAARSYRVAQKLIRQNEQLEVDNDKLKKALKDKDENKD